MRLIIVRHGETAANVARVIQGHTGSSLNARGALQVAKLAERLRTENVEVVYSSDSARARETALAASKLIGVPIEFATDLRERCYGEFEGRVSEEYESALVESNLDRHLFEPAGGESLVALEVRISRFLETVKAKHKGQTVLLVAHAGTNRMLLKILLKKDFDDWSSIQQENACVNIVRVSHEEGATPEVMNCTRHLSQHG